MMNISHDNDFSATWDAWERGRAEGLAIAVQMVEKQMSQKGSLWGLYTALLDAQLLLDAKHRR
jgi:hypothetical protein